MNLGIGGGGGDDELKIIRSGHLTAMSSTAIRKPEIGIVCAATATLRRSPSPRRPQRPRLNGRADHVAEAKAAATKRSSIRWPALHVPRAIVLPCREDGQPWSMN